MRIRIRQTDTLFSRLLRLKFKKCEKCGRRGEGVDGIDGLQCSHFYGRRNESTRFDFDNCDSLCFKCHQDFTENPAEYVVWKKKKLGERRFKLLEVLVNTYKKKDDKWALIWIKQELKEIKICSLKIK